MSPSLNDLKAKQAAAHGMKDPAKTRHAETPAECRASMDADIKRGVLPKNTNSKKLCVPGHLNDFGA